MPHPLDRPKAIKPDAYMKPEGEFANDTNYKVDFTRVKLLTFSNNFADYSIFLNYYILLLYVVIQLKFVH